MSQWSEREWERGKNYTLLFCSSLVIVVVFFSSRFTKKKTFFISPRAYLSQTFFIPSTQRFWKHHRECEREHRVNRRLPAINSTSEWDSRRLERDGTVKWDGLMGEDTRVKVIANARKRNEWLSIAIRAGWRERDGHSRFCCAFTTGNNSSEEREQTKIPGGSRGILSMMVEIVVCTNKCW